MSLWDSVVGGRYVNEATTTKLKDLFPNQHSIVATVISEISKVARSRNAFARDMAEISDFYLVDVILGALTDDAFAPDANTGDVVEITSPRPRLNLLLKAMQDSIDIDQIVSDVVPDLLTNGEYFLGYTDSDVDDTLIQSEYVAAYKAGIPVKYLHTRRHATDTLVEDPGSIIHFSYSNRRVRMSLSQETSRARSPVLSAAAKKFPKVLRVGRPLFYGGIISKLRELRLLEQLVPAQKLKQVASGSIVGVTVPQTMDPKDAFKVVQRYENLLNNNKGVNTQSGTLTASDIMRVSGSTRVIPVFGDRGDLRQMDVKDTSNVDDLLSGINDTRAVILSSIGIPPSLLFGGDMSKIDLIRQYSRYNRILRSLRTAVTRGLQQLAYIWLANNGVDSVNPKDVVVSYHSKLPDIQDLDTLELSQATVSIASDLDAFVSTLRDNENLKGLVDDAEYRGWLAKIGKTVFAGRAVLHNSQDRVALLR